MLDEAISSLPWYVNATLAESERADMARRLRTEPALRNELLFWEELAATQCRHVAVAEDIALQRTLSRIQMENRPQQSRKQEGWLRSWFAQMHARPILWLGPALAGGLVVVVAQSLVLHRPLHEDARLMRGTPVAATQPTAMGIDSALLRVVFDPATTEGEIRLLVAAQNASIVGGPGVGGEYYLAVPQQRVIAAIDALRATGAVREVSGVESLPPARTSSQSN